MNEIKCEVSSFQVQFAQGLQANLRPRCSRKADEVMQQNARVICKVSLVVALGVNASNKHQNLFHATYCTASC